MGFARAQHILQIFAADVGIPISRSSFMDHMIGKDFAIGLVNLKSVVKK
jgi:hypothetical protein